MSTKNIFQIGRKLHKKRKIKSSTCDQKALVIFDVFKGQMTSEVLEILAKNCILVTTLPANMTKHYQPLDLTVNGYAKKFLVKHFNEWYTAQISKLLEDSKALGKLRKIKVTILMMSAKMATLGLLKIKVFRCKDYDVMISLYDVIKKNLSRDSNFVVDVVM